MSSVSGRNFVVSRLSWVPSRSSAIETKIEITKIKEIKKNQNFLSRNTSIFSFINHSFSAAIYSLLIERKIIYFFIFFFLKSMCNACCIY